MLDVVGRVVHLMGDSAGVQAGGDTAAPRIRIGDLRPASVALHEGLLRALGGIRPRGTQPEQEPHQPGSRVLVEGGELGWIDGTRSREFLINLLLCLRQVGLNE